MSKIEAAEKTEPVIFCNSKLSRERENEKNGKQRGHHQQQQQQQQDKFKFLSGFRC